MIFTFLETLQDGLAQEKNLQFYSDSEDQNQQKATSSSKENILLLHLWTISIITI